MNSTPSARLSRVVLAMLLQTMSESRIRVRPTPPRFSSTSFAEECSRLRRSLSRFSLRSNLAIRPPRIELTHSLRSFAAQFGSGRSLHCSRWSQEKSALPELNGGQVDLQSTALPG